MSNEESAEGIRQPGRDAVTVLYGRELMGVDIQRDARPRDPPSRAELERRQAAKKQRRAAKDALAEQRRAELRAAAR